MKRYGKDASIRVVSTDLKQMYTFLAHIEIRRATLWVLENTRIARNKNNNQHNTTRVLRTRPTFVQVDREAPYTARFTTNKGNDSNSVVFTLDDLYQIVCFDLDTTYSRIGNQIFIQKTGCPMGGFLSSFYGNTVCALHENEFLTRHPRADAIQGIRQMDDLMLFIISTNANTNADADFKDLVHQISHNVYKGGLETEIQEATTETVHKYTHEFAGHVIHTHKRISRGLYATTLNVNQASVRQGRGQVKIRYPHMHTYVNRHSKTGNIIGTLHRLRNQNTYRKDFTAATHDFIAELQSIGYPSAMIKKCIYRMTHKEGWRQLLADVTSTWTRKYKRTSTTNRTRTTPKKYRRPEEQQTI